MHVNKATCGYGMGDWLRLISSLGARSIEADSRLNRDGDRTEIGNDGGHARELQKLPILIRILSNLVLLLTTIANHEEFSDKDWG